MMNIQVALQHHRSGHLMDAVEIYESILKEDPRNADALHLMGVAACELGDADLSIALVSQANALFPQNINYLLSLGMAYRARNSCDQAMVCYAFVLQIDPHCASAFFGMGNTAQHSGKLDEAIDYFAAAIELHPQFVEAYYNLANVQKSRSEYAEAAGNYRKALELQPDFADAAHNLGGALYALGKLEEALAAYRNALRLNLPETHNSIGNIFFDQGLTEQAADSYRQAIKIKPEYAEPYNNLGNGLRRLGKFGDAAAAFEKALNLAPEYAAASLNLGDLLLETGNLHEAVLRYQKTIAISPSMAEAYFHLGVARDSLNDPQAAITCFMQALHCRPDYVDALYNLGVVHGRLLQYAEAERWYWQALHVNPRHVGSHINLSAIMMEDGRKEEARRHIDNAYTRQNLFEKYTRGAARTVLILFDAGKGNVNLSYLFSKEKNNLLDWMIEYASEDQAAKLPHYDLVFNAMADADATGDSEAAVRHFLQTCHRPVFNPPHKVARTARHLLPELLQGIAHIVVPQVQRISGSAGHDYVNTLSSELPLIIRPVDSHGGAGLVLIDNQQQLRQCSTALSGPAYITRFVDYRSADSWYRKYRMIFVDRKPYPYHLAISQHWMVHYFNADMEAHAWKLQEEKNYLEHPEKVLGAAGMKAITDIGARMDLDYAGIDFTVLPDGRILVFEANPTMLAHAEDSRGPLAHKNVQVSRIFNAFEDALQRATTAC